MLTCRHDFFGNNPTWTCTSDAELLTLFNTHFPLPQQQSWTVYHLNCAVVTRVTSILQMKPFALDNWRQLPTRGRCVGVIGAPTSNTWEWTRTYNRSHTPHGSNALQDLQHGHKQDTMDMDDRFRVARSLALSWPLARRLLWPATKTQQKSEGPRNSSQHSKLCWTVTQKLIPPLRKNTQWRRMSPSCWLRWVMENWGPYNLRLLVIFH